jgi:hypothetical protein
MIRLGPLVLTTEKWIERRKTMKRISLWVLIGLIMTVWAAPNVFAAPSLSGTFNATGFLRETLSVCPLLPGGANGTDYAPNPGCPWPPFNCTASYMNAVFVFNRNGTGQAKTTWAVTMFPTYIMGVNSGGQSVFSVTGGESFLEDQTYNFTYSITGHQITIKSVSATWITTVTTGADKGRTFKLNSSNASPELIGTVSNDLNTITLSFDGFGNFVVDDYRPDGTLECTLYGVVGQTSLVLIR